MALSAYSLPFFIALHINAILGLIILLNNFRTPINRLLGSLMILLSLWNFGDFLLTLSASKSVSMWLARGVWSITPLLPAVFIHAAMIFPKERKVMRSKLTYFVIYFPAAVLIYFAWFSEYLISGPQAAFWAENYFTYGPAIHVYTAYFVLAFALGAAIFLKVMSRSSSNRERFQSKWFLLATSVPIIGGVSTNLLLPMFGVYAYPIAGPLSAVMSLLLAYAMLRYRFIDISSHTYSEILLSTLPGIVILLDADQKIVKTNRQFEELTGYTENELFRQPLHSLLSEKDRAAGSPWHKWEKKQTVQFQPVRFRAKNSADVPLNFSGSIITDEAGDITGFLGVGFTDEEFKIIRSEAK